ncbi:MAG: hypothetical protein EAZ79_14335 [Oscillatoriales cyanobacterium]|nr:MAG: hypothetical protein EAZ79_14335 [Oscillatoriales cyanobacterium]
MGAIIQQIQTSLLNLLGQAIEAMPSIAAAVVVIVLTNTAAKFVSLAIALRANCCCQRGSVRGGERESGRMGEWEIRKIFLIPDD